MTSVRLLSSVLLPVFVGVMLVISVNADNSKNTDISELSRKIFRVSESNGKASLTVMTGKDPIKDHMDIWQAFVAKPCRESVAILNLAGKTSYAQTTNGKILSFLECGMWDSSPAEYVIAFFDPKALESPQCASIVDLAKVTDPSWLYGRVKSFDIRKASDKEYNAVITAGGGCRARLAVHCCVSD